MPSVSLDIDELLLDLDSPALVVRGVEREALQKIIEDQDIKLVILAESIVADRLNPMDRWLVIRGSAANGANISFLRATGVLLLSGSCITRQC